MASVAEDRTERADGAKAPISTHPVFPLVVALWFAALLGLGCMILPVALLERAVEVTGFSAILPAAAPPLGFTARILISGTGTLMGAAIGFLLARRLARMHGPRKTGRLVAGPDGRRPINALEELADNSLVEPRARRRTSLAAQEDDRPSEYLHVEPLPLQDRQKDAGDGAEAPPLDEPHEPHELHEPHEPLELEAIAPPPGHERADLDPPAMQIEPDTDISDEDHGMSERQEFRPRDSAPADLHEEGEPQGGAPLAEADDGGDEPLDFSPPSLAGKRAMPEAVNEDEEEHEDRDEDADADGEAAEAGEPGLVQLVQRLGKTIEKRREWASEKTARPVAAPEPDRAPEQGGDAPRRVPGDFDVAEPDEAAEATANFFKASSAAFAEEDQPDDRPTPEAAAESEGPAMAGKDEAGTPPVADSRPPARSPFPDLIDDEDLDEEDEDDIGEIAASFSLPIANGDRQPEAAPDFSKPDPARTAARKPAPAGRRKREFDPLPGMKNPFKDRPEQFVRVEDPADGNGAVEPAVVFPNQKETSTGQAEKAPRPFDKPDHARTTARERPADTVDNERALREALMNLQRMSGAA